MSTTEAEYMALSMAMRKLLWIRRTIAEVADRLAIPYDKNLESYPKSLKTTKARLQLQDDLT